MRHTVDIYTKTHLEISSSVHSSSTFITLDHRGSHLPGSQQLKSNLYLFLSEILNKSFYLSGPQFP